MAPIYNSYPIPPEITQAFKDASAAKAGMKQAWKEAHPTTGRLGKTIQPRRPNTYQNVNTTNAMQEENINDLTGDD
jgi:hypothetical protein